MKKSLMIASLIIFGSSAAFGAESYEVCTDVGPCALRVQDNETGKDVWLVRESGIPIMDIWEGEFWLVSESDYEGVLDMIPSSQRLTIPGINPTTGQRMEAKVTPKTGGGSPSPSITGGGPLIGGNISVNVGTDNPCSPCHSGSMRDIHKQVLKPQGGK